MPRNESKRVLIQTILQTLGNKGYVRSIEAMLERVELKPDEAQALLYLARDLQAIESDRARLERDARTGFRH